MSAIHAVCCLIMKWTDHHICVIIVGLLKTRRSVRKIFGLLRSLKIIQHFVEHTKQHYEETGDVVDCPRQGWLHLACTNRVVEVVWPC